MSRKMVPKEVREKVWQKFGGYCAYCGCALNYEDMQIDHLYPYAQAISENHYKPLSKEQEDKLNEFDNLMPACRMCNYYKSTMSLDKFRKELETTLLKNATKSYDFRLAEKYGLVKQEPHDIYFWFEEYESK